MDRRAAVPLHGDQLHGSPDLPILARTIQADLHISDIQYSNVVQAFLLAYTLSYLLAGRLTDRLGTRVSMAVFIVWWSVADMLTSLSRSVWMLGGFRFFWGSASRGTIPPRPKRWRSGSHPSSGRW